ncbi:pyrroloquinoline-quinone synthase PqqC [Cupriavidus necator]|uniref:pyrroloquinoline-quinone synthase PqqC n=1 Tax=Cupriavidus necator TaxID=106590 RepID=UPI00339D60DB
MTNQIAWTPAEFEARLRAMESGYHIHHPFNRRMAAGQCSPAQIRAWVANRFYYQANIPLKDAAILSNCPDRDTRREWVVRILDHDGTPGATESQPGGIEAWLRLGQAVGLERDALLAQQHVLPGVRFAVDAYVNFARRAPWQEAVCSSLTEMFAPEIHKQRLAGWPTQYPWIEAAGLDYFRSRIPLAQRDVNHGLRVTLDYFRTAEQQQRALDILQFKLDVLWSMLDAIQQAHP